ncbi:MAG: bifunctional folylpolyglutamate synthase/dihydrofolate synthase [Gemmatimonadota bacterium]|nr:bifunctional folylpolyglutamate synthase/dihydrofolate synthase [Gemmatimonadota bacterium]
MGNPQLQYPVFHVAGTNGKGSTIATLDALLRGAGYRVGRYTSPHLVDFRERIVVNGLPMAPEAIVEFLARWDPEAARLGTTFFEVTTAMAFAQFAVQRVDVALIEVGLGGRLDATNVVQPIAAAVTQIGFDHVEYLGNTLVEIAGEKAGVFKRGAVAVIGDTRPETAELLTQHAEHAGASEILVAGRDWQVSETSVGPTGTGFSHTVGGQTAHLHTALTGVFQAENSATALAMLRGAGGEWTRVADRAGEFLPSVHIAGRFHRVDQYIFDVAHNPDGAATVAQNLRGLNVPAPIVALVSVLGDKDWRGILSQLAAVTDQLILTSAPTAPVSRAWNADEVLAWSLAQGFNATLERNFDRALDIAKRAGATVLITGSFHTVGDAMERLQVDPLAR